MADRAWSKADTHCVWCGRELGDGVRYDSKEHADDCGGADAACWCQSACWRNCDERFEHPESVLLELRATIEAQGITLAEVAASGVEFDDSRVGWLSVQIDRPTWDSLQRLAEEETDGW